MPASSMFWDEAGNKTLSYEYDYGTYTAINTKEEFERSRALDVAYHEEMSRLDAKYGNNGYGRISLNQIHADLAEETKKRGKYKRDTS